MNKSKLPEKMEAWLLTGFGGYDKLVKSTVDTPSVQPGEVLVSVLACGINNSDIWLREGGYVTDVVKPDNVSTWRGDAPHFPIIQGSDIVGHIVKVGQNVNPLRIGERVLVNPTLYKCLSGSHEIVGYVGSERNGGFAKYVAVPEINTQKIDSILDDCELATFPCSYLTAEHMLNKAKAQQGNTIIITGASGGVGSALTQLAINRGCHVICIVSSSKEKMAFDLGAQNVILRETISDMQSLLKNLNNEKVDIVCDVVGGTMMKMLIKCLKHDGNYVLAGAISDPLVSLDLRDIYMNQIKIIGSSLGTSKEFSNLIHHIETGKIKPLLARTFHMDELITAQKFFKIKNFFGKIVVSNYLQ